MNELEKFYEAIKKEMTITLATAAGGGVTMRLVSPVYYEGRVLIFTAADSIKYWQMKENPNCCIEAKGFFAESVAEFCGSTMLEGNKKLRDAYSEKFHGAFDEGVAFGGREAEFILLKPVKIKGWTYENDKPNAEGIPTVPFEYTLD